MSKNQGMGTDECLNPLSQWISAHKTEQGQKGPDAAAVKMGGWEWRMEGALPPDWICTQR